MDREQILKLIKDFRKVDIPITVSDSELDNILDDLRMTFSDYIGWERSFIEQKYHNFHPEINKLLNKKIANYKNKNLGDFKRIESINNSMNKIILAFIAFLSITKDSNSRL